MALLPSENKAQKEAQPENAPQNQADWSKAVYGQIIEANQQGQKGNGEIGAAQREIFAREGQKGQKQAAEHEIVD